MKHQFTQHSVTEINGAGVQVETWEGCIVCGQTQSQYEYLNPECPGYQEWPRADCEGCHDLKCPCNAEVHQCGKCGHLWMAHIDGECESLIEDGSICGCEQTKFS